MESLASFRRRTATTLTALLCITAHLDRPGNFTFANDAPEVRLQQSGDRVQIHIGPVQVAEYVFRDDQVLRPYFHNVRTLSDIQVTRTHPPVAGVDSDDHAIMHPGLWLAFGDISGADFWRNKGRVNHERFLTPPTSGAGRGGFTVANVYEAQGKTVLREECAIQFEILPSGYLIDWTSTFTAPEGEAAFGDQEEMGLGIRMATPLAVNNGGQIVNSEERKNEAEVWGRPADWCAYRGALEGRRVGIALMPHPTNFRRSWFHARDYGLLVANPFGQNAFTKAAPSRIIVTGDNPLTLRFGIYIFDTPPEAASDIATVYKGYSQ